MKNLSPENGNISGFRNVVFFSYLEYRVMGKVQNASDPEDNTKSSDHFRI
jgi:hypothetical protein